MNPIKKLIPPFKTDIAEIMRQMKERLKPKSPELDPATKRRQAVETMRRAYRTQ